ncbi:hypothetical protein AAE478_000512 [Parahypoxylon ruwenzoriense]
MPADNLSLAGKVAIVTGSGRENGIGAAIARALARNGASVAIHYVSESSAQRARETAQSIRDGFGVGVALVQADVATPEGAQRIVAETLEALGVDHVDILVNNAGAAIFSSLVESAPEPITFLFGVNVLGPLYLTQAVVKLGKMPRGGRIINIGSMSSKMGVPDLGIYCATKAAQDSLTTSWAGELGRTHGITVNTLAPGPAITDMISIAPEKIQLLVDQQRGADHAAVPEDIADAVLLIASEKSRWVTAQYIAVDAGITGTR